jgi:delta-aminolevulinic acid dehydratase/porphobilinogen synthase
MSFYLDSNSDKLSKTIKKAFDAGIPIVTTAGNCKPDDKDKKARGTLCEHENTICVGATDINYNKGWVRPITGEL